MRILCVHQGFELYGSDRCFLESVQTIRETFPSARLAAQIPRDGPLAARLLPFVDALEIAPLWVIRKHGLARLLARAPLEFPRALGRAHANFRAHDLVYISTVTVLDHLLAAALWRDKALLHVHEAPGGWIGAGFGALLRAVAPPTIFNSETTRRAYRPSRDMTSYVLHNGIEGPATAAPPDYDGRRPLRLLMIGRLSPAKGQDLLIEACGLLPEALRARVVVKIAGGTFGEQADFEQRLRDMAHDFARERAGGAVDVLPFVEDAGGLFSWCDLAVVPSRVHESFGRVPVEAMAHARGSIVAAHGGLLETGEAERNCWRFAPGDAAALSAVLKDAILSPEKVRLYGEAGRRRYEQKFAAPIIAARLREILRRQAAAARANAAPHSLGTPQFFR